VVDTNLRQELLLYVFFPDFGPILTSFNSNILYSLCASMVRQRDSHAVMNYRPISCKFSIAA
jgi:hypothetical protein